MSKFWNVASPITVHVEVTEACNERCRHCYNFYRLESYKPKEITWEDLNDTIERLIENKVLHVIITGGEPLLALDKVLHLAEKCLDAGMSVNLNSNLVAANDENMRQLREVGIDHILTTLHSHKEELHDWLAATPGAFKKIIRGIKAAQDNGIRVTVNTVLFSYNRDDIYETGKFLHSIGVRKFLVNRAIPSPGNPESMKPEYRVGRAEMQKMLDDLLRLKSELGMEIGTCRMIPECFFDDLKKYPEFINRGCAAGRKHLLLTVEGESRACVHESMSYGNVHKIGLAKIWENMAPWRSDEYIPDECRDCPRFDTCDGGCRLIAKAYTDSMKGRDNLSRGRMPSPKFERKQTNKRREDGFWVVRTRGAKVNYIDDEGNTRYPL